MTGLLEIEELSVGLASNQGAPLLVLDRVNLTIRNGSQKTICINARQARRTHRPRNVWIICVGRHYTGFHLQGAPRH